MTGPGLKGPEPLLAVEDLRVHLPASWGTVRAVDGVSFRLAKGKTLAIVGESGCGKSMLCRSIMGLAPSSAVFPDRARILFSGTELSGLSEKQLNRIRGRKMAMVFQDPMTSLNPAVTIGRQLMEGMRYHFKLQKEEAVNRAVELLRSVGIPNPSMRLGQHPHQLSGGMRQRVAIAIALSCRPELLIADEPTTALDVTVQSDILSLLARFQEERDMAMILVTHDLGVAGSFADEIAVMYAGRIVEQAASQDLFDHYRMPYTRMLVRAIPRLSDPPHTRLPVIDGRPPDLSDPPSGCRFAPRCPDAADKCVHNDPPLVAMPGTGHSYACFFPINDTRSRKARKAGT